MSTHLVILLPRTVPSFGPPRWLPEYPLGTALSQALQLADFVVLVGSGAASPEAALIRREIALLGGDAKLEAFEYFVLRDLEARVSEGDWVLAMSWEFFVLTNWWNCLSPATASTVYWFQCAVNSAKAALFSFHSVISISDFKLWNEYEILDGLAAWRQTLAGLDEEIFAEHTRIAHRDLPVSLVATALTLPPEFVLRTQGDYMFLSSTGQNPVLHCRLSPALNLCSIFSSAGYSGGEESLIQTLAGLKRLKSLAVVVVCRRDTLLAERCANAGLETICLESLSSLHHLEVEAHRNLLDRLQPGCIHFNSPAPPWQYHLAIGMGVPILQHWRLADCKNFSREAKLADHHICVSNFVASRLKECGIADENLSVVYNGLDGAFYPRPKQRRMGKAKIVCLSRITPSKNLEVLLAALALLGEEAPRWQCKIFGEAIPSERGYLHSLHREILRLELEKLVSLNEFSLAARSELAEASMLVLPSKDEPLARSILESMYLGVPVIASASGGNSEILTSGKTGWLFDPNSPSDLASTIRMVLARAPEEISAVTSAAYDTVTTRFSIDGNVESTYRTIQTLSGKIPRGFLQCL